jgi:hypothetical protein
MLILMFHESHAFKKVRILKILLLWFEQQDLLNMEHEVFLKLSHVLNSSTK